MVATLSWSADKARHQDAVPWHLSDMQPQSPVKFGLIVNPRARRLRDDRETRELASVATSSEVKITHRLSDITPAIRDLMKTGVNVLAIAGGDGTIHHVLQSLVHEEKVWPGKVIALRGGTLNIMARQYSTTHQMQTHLVTAQQLWGHKRLGELPSLAVPLLRIKQEQQSRYGFVFGSEMVKNALELYDEFGGGYSGLSKFLFEVAKGYSFNTPLWMREKWRLTPPTKGLSIDIGGTMTLVPSYSAAIASTIDLAIGNGAVRSVIRNRNDQGFFARIITETRISHLLRMIPALMRAVPLEAVVDSPVANKMNLYGSYTIDGECIGHSRDTRRGVDPLTVEAGGSISVLPI